MKKMLLFFLIAAVLSITGCTKKEELGVQPSKSSDIEEKNQVELSKMYPLSGIATNDDIDNRAVAVMVNNHVKARPQTGLSKADIVYEILAEAEVTRFLAIYQSEFPEEVGPIRSARDYYINLAKGFDCIYVCHGNSPDAKVMMDNNLIDSLNGIKYDGILFKRSKDRKAPHNSYISFENIKKGAEMNSYDLTGAPKAFKFLESSQMKNLKGESANTIKISYGSVSYDSKFIYNEAKEKYTRYSNGNQTLEYEDDTPILVDNILIIEAPHRIIDGEGRRDIDLKVGGKAYLFQKGKMNKVEWENKEGRIVPVKNGSEVGLVPGETWVSVIPDQPGLEKLISFEETKEN